MDKRTCYSIFGFWFKVTRHAWFEWWQTELAQVVTMGLYDLVRQYKGIKNSEALSSLSETFSGSGERGTKGELWKSRYSQN